MKSSKRTRRTHSPEFKAKLIAECLQPGASIAAVAMAHQINDNLLRVWVRNSTLKEVGAQPKQPIDASPRIVPVQLATPIEPIPFVRIHIQQGSTQIHLEWPLASVALCNDWLRGFLR